MIGETFEDLGGIGRVVTYEQPISMKSLEASIKHWLKLQHSRETIPLADYCCIDISIVQVAYPEGFDSNTFTVRSVAVGAGSAGSLVAASKADVWLTGEMQHHEVLAAVASGHCVMLCQSPSGNSP